MSVAPPGIDQHLWDFVAIITAVQAAQATGIPNAQQIAAIQTALNAVTTISSSAVVQTITPS